MLRSLAVAALAALTLPFAQPSAAQEGSLTIAYHSGPANEAPDPRARQYGWLSNQSGVTETLMGLDRGLQLYPRLAASIEQADPTTWRVILREGITFHDGSPVTAQSVIDSLTPIAEEGHPAHNLRLVGLLDLAGMETDGELVVVFRTNSPNAAFPWTLSEPGVAILGEASEDFPINATGPFIFREAIPDQLYRVEANPNYRDGAPALAEVRVVKAADPAAAALAFEAGEVDLVINYPETDYERILSTGAQGFAAPTTRLFFYGLNASNGPLENPLIRRAVSLAIDRQGIVDAALSGVGGVPAGAIFPQVMGWAADIAPVYDPAEAERLLAEAGAVKEGGRWMLDGEPLTIDIVTYASRAALPPTAELTQAYLEAIGVAATVSIGEFGANNDAIKNGTADMHLQAWGTAPQGDPSYFPETLLAGPGFKVGGNVGGYANPELDALLAKGRQTFDEAERRATYARVQEIIAAEAALIPVFHASAVTVGRAGLNNFAVHPAETYWIDTQVSLSE
ncbi:ABC transporter substrate-binding protein [Pelagibius sp.]|uniref:ABC transporter substrate-binding protein n=1 Tax=Pelagibius sp. TaxID=1931238 RepID=UPI003B5017A0